MTAKLAGDLPAAWKRAVTRTVDLGPLSRLPLKIPATRSAFTSGHGPVSSAVVGAFAAVMKCAKGVATATGPPQYDLTGRRVTWARRTGSPKESRGLHLARMLTGAALVGLIAGFLKR